MVKLKRPELRMPTITSSTLGAIVGVVIALYLLVYLMQTIKHNYDLQQQINLLQQQNANLETETEALSYRIQYYQTDDYKEKEAREKLGLQQPGEGVVILPRKDEPTASAQVENQKRVKQHSNIQQWIDFIAGRH